MADDIDENGHGPVRTPGTLVVGVAEGGVETVVVGEFLRRSGDVLVYRGLYRDAAVHLLEYAPPAFAVRGDEDEVWPIPPRIARKQPGNSTTADPNFTAGRERFAAQTDVLKTLTHPNIVEVIAGFWAGGAIWRVEAVSGASLAERLADREIEATDDIRWIASDLAAGLEAAHAAGLTHLDVSPETVVAGPDGEQLSAFGVDRRPYLAETSDRDRLVRPGYAPLELDDKTGEEPIGPATDVHALGALIWRLMTGSAPANWSERDGPPAPAAGAVAWPTALLEATQAGLVVEPEQRLQTAVPFVRADKRPPPPPPPPPLPPPPGPRTDEGEEAKRAAGSLDGLYKVLVAIFILAFIGACGALLIPVAGLISDALRPPLKPAVVERFDPVKSATSDAAPEGCLWSLKPSGTVVLFCDEGNSDYVEASAGDLRPGDVKAANGGDPVAMLKLARYYLFYDGQSDRGIALLRSAGEGGYDPAYMTLADVLSHRVSFARPQASSPSSVGPDTNLPRPSRRQPFPPRDAREARRIYLIVANGDSELAQTARAQVLALDPEVWSGRWKREGGEVCKDLVLTDAAVTFWDWVYYTGPIMTPRTVAGQFQRQLADGLTLMRAQLDPTGLSMTLDFTAADGVGDTERYVRCGS